MRLARDIRAITPVIATIILLAMTITVSLAAVFWLQGFARPRPIEHLGVYAFYGVDERSGSNGQRYIIYEIVNYGADSASVIALKVDFVPIAVSGLPITIKSDRNTSITASYQWSLNTWYTLEAISGQGIHWPDYVGTPIQVLSSGGPCSNAIWSNGTITIPGSRNTVSGGLHTNKDFSVSGSTNTVDGRVEYVGNFNANNLTNTFLTIAHVQASGQPFSFNIADYMPGGSAAQAAQTAGMYHYVSGDLQFSQNNVTISPGLYYVTGSVHVSASYLKGDVTFVSEGPISVSGSYNNFTSYTNKLLFFSHSGSIQAISGSYNFMEGVIYAPNGQAALPGSSNTLYGYVLAQSATIPGSNWYFWADNAYCPA